MISESITCTFVVSITVNEGFCNTLCKLCLLSSLWDRSQKNTEAIRNKRLKRIIIIPHGAAMNAVASKYVESRSYFLCSHHSEFAPRKKLALKIKRQIDPFVISRLFPFPPFLQEVLSTAVSRTVNIISKWNFATIRVRHIRVHTCIKVRSDMNVNFLFVHLSPHFVLCELCTFSQIQSHILLHE